MQFYCTYSQVYALPMPFFTQAIYAEIRKIASVTYPFNFDFKHRFDSKHLPNQLAPNDFSFENVGLFATLNEYVPYGR